MSRVHTQDKYMNTNKYSSDVTNPTKVIRSKAEEVHPEKAKSLTSWLFLKYNMSYKAYRKKSKERRDALRDEYMQETGNTFKSRCSSEENYDPWDMCIEPSAIPMDADGEILGWD